MRFRGRPARQRSHAARLYVGGQSARENGFRLEVAFNKKRISQSAGKDVPRSPDNRQWTGTSSSLVAPGNLGTH
jgi:hypothetical protein